ncbi:hypothetical protein OH77DRAFT_644585 [Trametes cingulata]|nr:hypothetical protein OH77DRAFT_644585 [Trametes cingulata]
MANSRLPIEICERIMDALSDQTIWAARWSNFASPRAVDSAQDALRTLTACALTCGAWHHRAHFLLWRRPWLTGGKPVLAFTACLRGVTHSFARNFTTLVIGHMSKRSALGSRPGDLFLLSLPNLRQLSLRGLYLVTISYSVPPRLRTALALCANVTYLELTFCTFDKHRSMLDIIWSCSRLQYLMIHYCRFRLAPSQDEQARLAQACRNLNACKNLTHLELAVAPVSAQPSYTSTTAHSITL